MEEKTTAAEPRAPGCLLCNVALPFLEQLWPENTRQHFRNSRVEFLKGVRSIIDARIEHLSREHQKGTHVVVE
jgi:hypothetical protein